ncbi:MAG: BlaI/MecI/CopY family transcriptional regulator, partial [Muribaculaceae bacterium]|nr:BlaI/MecI/CopY family transcriptional regulator [Muribaculaceae bacterium]
SELSGNSLARLVKNYFNNSYRSVVSALVDDDKISVEELREIIDMVERRNKK